MAQDRINFLCQRLREGAVIARVIEAARAVSGDVSYGSKIPLADATGARTIAVSVDLLRELDAAVVELDQAAYIELPDY